VRLPVDRKLRRASVRLSLTLTYSALFVAAFGAVLGASYFLVKGRTGGTKTAVSVLCTNHGQALNVSFTSVSGQSGHSSGSGSTNSAVPTPSSGEFCAAQVSEAASGLVLRTTGPAGLAGVHPQFFVGPGTPGPKIAGLQQLEKAVNASRDHTLNTFLIESLAALGLMGIASIGLGWWMSGRALKPVHRITDTARRLSDQNLHNRINLDGPHDELKELADTFDGMLSRLDRAFTSQKRFVANASHELRTPLATERVLVDEALANPDATVEDLRAILEQLRANSEESELLMKALLALARSERGVEVWSPVDLADAAHATAIRASAEAAGREVEVRAQLDPAPTHGDPGLLERLAGNLVENAVRHNEPDGGGWVAVETGTRLGQAYLVVENSGPVIEPGSLDALVEPFRRGAGERHSSDGGFGLGLSIVEAIVSAHGGDLVLTARPEGGLRAEVRFDARVPEPVGVG
jgi:signal transduction histidine kinase